MRRFTHRSGTFGGKVAGHAVLLSVPLLLLASVSSALVGSPAPAQDPPPPAEPEIRIEEEVTVTATRLPNDEPAERRLVPAHVTVITRHEIESSGARTLQDLLTLEAGALVFDQIGNDVQKSFDLRGFAGSGTRVFLDGSPINDPRNNSVALELVPLRALDRIEITRGSVAALAGGGSEAGAINLWTRHGAESGASIEAAAGDFATREARVGAWRNWGVGDLFASGNWEETDGFRDNADGHLTRVQASLGFDLGEKRRLELSLIDSTSDYGSPGALTLAELDADRDQSPFNELDYIDEDMSHGTIQFSSGLGSSASLGANAFLRDRDDDTLTTGRAAASFGGFFSRTSSEVAGATLQLNDGHVLIGGYNRLAVGAEWLDGDTVAEGLFTSPSDPGTVDPGGLSSDNETDRSTLGFYLQDTWQPSDHWMIALGARYDDDEVGYDERFPEAGNDDSRDFSEVSLRGGVTWSASPAAALYVSYGEAFLPPTVEELFSFPLFGSNPELDPEDSTTLEIGYGGRFGSFELDAALFRIDSENEIVFDPFSPLGLFGANVNGGESRRDGIEIALRGRPGHSIRPFATATLIDAELLHGENDGKTLPLVPEERITVGFDLDLTEGVALRAEGLHVGDQVLANDEANEQQELDAYDVVNLRATWRPGERKASGGRSRGLVVFAELRNAFDEEYATRGIYAFDFSTFVNEVFLTPAPGRRFLGGVGWEF
jgi:outer membrane receptor protein involved in Fe transport